MTKEELENANLELQDQLEKSTQRNLDLELRIKQLESAKPADTAPDLTEGFTDGEFVNRKDGETYKLKLVPQADLGRTHHLRNEVHSWEGNEEEFKKGFIVE